MNSKLIWFSDSQDSYRFHFVPPLLDLVILVLSLLDNDTELLVVAVVVLIAAVLGRGGLERLFGGDGVGGAAALLVVIETRRGRFLGLLDGLQIHGILVGLGQDLPVLHLADLSVHLDLGEKASLEI